MKASERGMLATTLQHATCRLGADYAARRNPGLYGIGDEEPIAWECPARGCGYPNRYPAQFCGQCGRAIVHSRPTTPGWRSSDIPRSSLFWYAGARALALVLAASGAVCVLAF